MDRFGHPAQRVGVDSDECCAATPKQNRCRLRLEAEVRRQDLRRHIKGMRCACADRQDRQGVVALGQGPARGDDNRDRRPAIVGVMTCGTNSIAKPGGSDPGNRLTISGNGCAPEVTRSDSVTTAPATVIGAGESCSRAKSAVVVVAEICSERDVRAGTGSASTASSDSR